MEQHHSPVLGAAALAEMALVADLVEAAAAAATGGIGAGAALIDTAGQKLEAVPVDRWERVFALALEVVAKREGDDRAAHLRALAEVLRLAGNLAGAAELNEGEHP